MGEVWENVPEMLYHIGEFFFSPYLCLTVTETGTGLLDLFIDYDPPTKKDSKSDNLVVFKHLQVYTLFCISLQL